MMQASTRNNIEIKQWEIDWHGISFKDLGCPLQFDGLASAEFYNAFYTRFFERYSSFDELNPAWRHNKDESVNKLAQYLNNASSIFSYGCGIGYVESKLAELVKGDISCFDFSVRSAQFLLNNSPKVRYCSSVPEDEQFDAIYVLQVLYALPTDECLKLIKMLRKMLNQNGILILVNTSIDPSENRENGTGLKKTLLKEFVRPWYYRLSGASNHMQFWGWKRNNAVYVKILNECGFRVREISSAADQAFIVAECMEV